MDEDVGGGKLRFELVMVGDDQLQAEAAGGLGLGHAGDAAVDRDHDRRAPGGDLGQGLGVEAVALFEPVRHVDFDGAAGQLQGLLEDGGAGDAVDVVVAVDADLAPAAGGVEQAVGGLAHAGQQVGRVQADERGVEEAAGVLGPA